MNKDKAMDTLDTLDTLTFASATEEIRGPLRPGRSISLDLTNPEHCKLLFGAHWEAAHKGAIERSEKPSRTIRIESIDHDTKTVTFTDTEPDSE